LCLWAMKYDGGDDDDDNNAYCRLSPRTPITPVSAPVGCVAQW